MASNFIRIPSPSTAAIRSFALPNAVIITSVNPFRGAPGQEVQPDRAPRVSEHLGTPVFDGFSIIGGEYTDNNGNEYSFDTVVFDTVLITVEQAKNNVYTSIPGADGTVKEYIGLGDYKITIDGVIDSKYNGVAPKEAVAAMQQALIAPVPLVVVSDFLQAFEISEMVIDSFSLPQVEGGYSFQPFSITGYSDRTVEALGFNQ